MQVAPLPPGGTNLDTSRGTVRMLSRPGTAAPSAHVPHASCMCTPICAAMLMASRFWAAPASEKRGAGPRLSAGAVVEPRLGLGLRQPGAGAALAGGRVMANRVIATRVALMSARGSMGGRMAGLGVHAHTTHL